MNTEPSYHESNFVDFPSDSHWSFLALNVLQVWYSRTTLCSKIIITSVTTLILIHTSFTRCIPPPKRWYEDNWTDDDDFWTRKHHTIHQNFRNFGCQFPRSFPTFETTYILDTHTRLRSKLIFTSVTTLILVYTSFTRYIPSPERRYDHFWTDDGDYWTQKNYIIHQNLCNFGYDFHP